MGKGGRSNNQNRILVIDDEQPFLQYASQMLRQYGFQVLSTVDGNKGIELAKTEKPDLVLLDLGLPNIGVDTEGGEKVLREIRVFSQAPIIIVTVFPGQPIIARLFEAGADDFWEKGNGNPHDLIARIRGRILRERQQEMRQYVSGNLTVDFERKRVLVDGRQIDLSVSEYAIIEYLAKGRGKIRSQRQILAETLGKTYEGELVILRGYIKNIRQKIGQPKCIVSSYGVGYRIAVPEDIQNPK